MEVVFRNCEALKVEIYKLVRAVDTQRTTAAKATDEIMELIYDRYHKK